VSPPSATAEQAGCPNNNWTTAPSTVRITDVQLLISQGGATLFTCTANNPSGFTNGQKATLACE